MSIQRTISAGIILTGFLAVSAVAEERTWTSNDGKFTTTAELLKLEDQKVTLRKPDGQVIVVPLERLSKDDHDYLQSQAQRPSQAEQTAAIAKLRELKANLIGPRGSRLPVRVSFATSSPPIVTDDHVELFEKTPSLTALNLSRTGITDRGLQRLATNDRITELSIYHTRITDEGLKYIGQMKNLKKLELPKHISDDGVKYLAGMTQLESLEFGMAQVTDKSVEHIRNLKNLKTLNLHTANISDASAPIIGTFTELESLNVAGTNLTDEGVASFERLSKLKTLYIGAEGVTDKSVPALKAFRDLTFLNIMKTRITKEGADEIKAAFPKARINTDRY